MGEVLVRGLDDAVIERLRKRAENHHRSLEAELREILDQASRQVDVATSRELADRIRRRVQGRETLHGLISTSMELHSLTPLLKPAFEIAAATGRTVYDSVSLALAIALGCRLVTADKKLYNALRAGPFAEDVLWVADKI